MFMLKSQLLLQVNYKRLQSVGNLHSSNKNNQHILLIAYLFNKIFQNNMYACKKRNNKNAKKYLSECILEIGKPETCI